MRTRVFIATALLTGTALLTSTVACSDGGSSGAGDTAAPDPSAPGTSAAPSKTTTRPPSGTPAPSTAPQKVDVVLEAVGKVPAESISWFATEKYQQGFENNVRLPWSKQVQADAGAEISLTVTVPFSPDGTAPMATCRIRVNGKVVSKKTDWIAICTADRADTRPGTGT